MMQEEIDELKVEFDKVQRTIEGGYQSTMDMNWPVYITPNSKKS